MIYRGLKFRPSVKEGSKALDVWDENRGQWFYTSLVNDKKVLDYYLTEQAGKWGRTMVITIFDLETMKIAGSLRFTS